MGRAEIAELFYNALIGLNDLEKVDRFLSARVQWTLSAADPHTVGGESPPNAITFSGKEGCRQLALYFQDSLKMFSGDLTGCISHHLKRESRAEIDLQEVVLGPVNDIPGGFGEHPNMGSKSILEPSTKVTQHPVTKAQGSIRAYPIVPQRIDR
jgi:hypothetical protein